MAKNKNYQKVSPETQNDAMKAAKATQRPGQTKEQTKLIAQGIEKGVSYYKKQQKEKARELNRRLLKASKHNESLAVVEVSKDINDKVSVSFFSWLLLVVSWLGFAVYVFL